MLTYRLTGTTEASVSDRDGPTHRPQPRPLPPEAQRNRSPHRIFASHGELEELYGADLRLCVSRGCPSLTDQYPLWPISHGPQTAQDL